MGAPDGPAILPTSYDGVSSRPLIAEVLDLASMSSVMRVDRYRCVHVPQGLDRERQR